MPPVSQTLSRLIGALLCLAALTACTTPSDLPPLDVSGPGWQTWQGQAVWDHRFSDDALIGEFVSGVSRAQGISFAELSKGGVPVVRGRRTLEQWEIQFLPMNVAQRGKGPVPSSKWIFLHVPEILNGGPTPEGWRKETPPGKIILTNAKLKERLELVLDEQSRQVATASR